MTDDNAMLSMLSARSFLFVPGHQPARYAKAAAAQADMVCIDWEDAVPASDRPAARLATLGFLPGADPQARFGVRINSLHTADGLIDLLALREAPVPPAWVMLAKVESADTIEQAAELLPGMPFMALLESARGLQQAVAIAHAHPQLMALMLGGADLAADLRCDFAWEPLLHARCTLVAAAASAAVAVFDVPFLALDDPAGALVETRRVAALGFTGKAAVHPSQVAAIHQGMAPSAAALAQARRVVAAAADNTGAIRLDGRLVDRPVVLAAQRLLRRASD